MGRNGIRPLVHHEFEVATLVCFELRGIIADQCHVVGHRHGAVSGRSIGTHNTNDAGMVPRRSTSVRRRRPRAVDLEHDPCRLDTTRYRHKDCPGILARLPGRVGGIPTRNPSSFPLGSE